MKVIARASPKRGGGREFKSAQLYGLEFKSAESSLIHLMPGGVNLGFSLRKIAGTGIGCRHRGNGLTDVHTIGEVHQGEQALPRFWFAGRPSTCYSGVDMEKARRRTLANLIYLRTLTFLPHRVITGDAYPLKELREL